MFDRDVSNLQEFPNGVVVFDRDGTLIEDAGQHNDVSRLTIIPFAMRAIEFLNSQNYGIAIASNQAGLESGKFSLQDLHRFNAELRVQANSIYGAEIHLFALCPHLATSNCNCRKPKPGLLHTINEIGLGRVSLFVGNSESDRLAAERYSIKYMDINSKRFLNDIVDWANK